MTADPFLTQVQHLHAEIARLTAERDRYRKALEVIERRGHGDRTTSSHTGGDDWSIAWSALNPGDA